MQVIAGVDEVGRGSLMGPVFAAAVILDKKIILYIPTKELFGLRDIRY